MGLQKYFDVMFQNQAMETNVAFIGKVISVSEDLSRAEIQPMGLIQQQGATALPQATIGGVPIIESAKYKLETTNLHYVSRVSGGGSTSARAEYSDIEILTRTPLCSGDLVLCVCCDRDISQALKGINSLPDVDVHSKNSAVVVGILEAKT